MMRIVRMIAFMMLGFLLRPESLPAIEYSLEDLYKIALESSEKIKTAEENLAISKITKDKALSVLIPKLTAYGNLTQYSERKYTEGSTPVPGLTLPGSLIQPDRTANWGVRLDQSFSLSARELLALEMAGENIRMSERDLDALREAYLFNVAVAYYDVLKAKKYLDIAEANLVRLSTYRNAAEKRFRVGEITKTVLLRADSELSGARSDRLKAANGLDLARAFLARLVGIDKEFTLREESTGEEDVPNLPILQDTALSERSDLKSMEIAKNVAQKQVRFVRGTFWPNLALAGVYNRSDQHPLFSSFNRESVYGLVSLNFPFFEGGLRMAEVREARAKERQAGYLYDDLRKSIEIEVEGAYLDLITQRGILKFLNDQLLFAKDNYRAVERQFEVGLASSIDIIDANTLLVSAERQVSEANYNYQLFQLRLRKAMGVLLKEIRESNSAG
ncbi:MAG: TolC family protein [Deltaproteobacteria bacterium]|nr:TolC family protein [Deltaproteobacteria bacterium]